jgi:hypothetical protein
VDLTRASIFMLAVAKMDGRVEPGQDRVWCRIRAHQYTLNR